MIHFFCALPCEAQPIIQHFNLTGLNQFNLFRIYQSKDKQTSLTITGIGKLNASAAVSFHHACINTSADNIWLNVGVAGHASIPVGEARLINKITDNQYKSYWYPQILFEPPCHSASLITLDKPSTNYQNVLYDMEASGFYPMVLRLGTAELIHSLKIISDNDEQPTSSVNTDKVKNLIAAHTRTIDCILDSLKPFAIDMASIIKEPEHYQEFIELWHFTQSERIQLSRLLRKWTVRSPDEDIMQSVTYLKTGKSVLNELKNKVTESEFVIYD